MYEEAISLTKFERPAAAKFRELLSQAESDQDVIKFFHQTVRDFLAAATENQLDVDFEDVELTPDSAPYFRFSNRLTEHQAYQPLTNSDLVQILSRFAEQANKHIIHLNKHPEKTNGKIKGQQNKR